MQVDRTPEYVRLTEELNALQDKFAAAAALWNGQLRTLRDRYPRDAFELDNGITNLLQSANIRASVVDRVLQVEKLVDRTVEIPVQDIKTKSLIQHLTT
jgi:hypothetical protein